MTPSHSCSTPAPLLLHSCFTPAPLLLHSCSTPAPLLLHLFSISHPGNSFVVRDIPVQDYCKRTGVIPNTSTSHSLAAVKCEEQFCDLSHVYCSIKWGVILCFVLTGRSEKWEAVLCYGACHRCSSLYWYITQFPKEASSGFVKLLIKIFPRLK